jgi:hypothetical protein
MIGIGTPPVRGVVITQLGMLNGIRATEPPTPACPEIALTG